MMNRLKGIFVLLVLFLAFGQPAWAQDSVEQELTFVYIAHDENTPTSELIKRLRSVYEDAVNYPESCAAIFYLPNGEYPKVVRVNVGKDNRSEFVEIVGALQSTRSHDVDSNVDIETIQKIFEEVDIINESGYKRFASVQWIYYINSTFWTLKYNEDIIAALYFIMDMEPLIKSKYLKVTMYYSEEHDKIPYNRQQPFGEMNLCPLLKQVPLPY